MVVVLAVVENENVARASAHLAPVDFAEGSSAAIAAADVQMQLVVAVAVVYVFSFAFAVADAAAAAVAAVEDTFASSTVRH